MPVRRLPEDVTQCLGLQLPQRGGQRCRRLLDIALGVRGAHEARPAEQVDSAEQHAAVQRRRHLRGQPAGLQRRRIEFAGLVRPEQQVEGGTLPRKPGRAPRLV
jgi:hypothetical protein